MVIVKKTKNKTVQKMITEFKKKVRERLVLKKSWKSVAFTLNPPSSGGRERKRLKD